MWLVTRLGIGSVVFDRLRRDGVVATLHADGGLPADIEAAPGVRAASLAHAVPSHTALTGLGALWVRGTGPAPRSLIVAAPPGAHRVESPGLIATTLRTSAGTVARAVPLGGIRCAQLDDAAADALRWESLALVYPTLFGAFRTGVLTPHSVADAVAGRSSRAPGYKRMAEAWRALAGALEH